MKKYQHVIDCVMNNQPILTNENLNPNLQFPTEEIMKVRKVNFKLQDQKAELIQELKMLREVYIKQKKTSESRASLNQSLRAQLSAIKDKLKRTQDLKNKVEKRLYSTKPNTSTASKSSASTKGNSNFITQRQPVTYRASLCEQSVQTNQPQTYTMGCQADQGQNWNKAQGTKCPKQKSQSKKVAPKVNITTAESDRGSVRSSTDGNLTERLTGRIVKGRRH